MKTDILERDERLLKVPEVAERLAIVPFQVRRLIWRGQLRSVRIGRAVRVRAEDVAAFIDENTVTAKAAV